MDQFYDETKQKIIQEVVTYLNNLQTKQPRLEDSLLNANIFFNLLCHLVKDNTNYFLQKTQRAYQENFVLVTDSDTDGLSSAIIWIKFLQIFGFTYKHNLFVVNTADDYVLYQDGKKIFHDINFSTREAIDALNPCFILVLDSSSNASTEEKYYFAKHKCPFVVIDHHEVNPSQKVDFLINPKQDKCQFKEKEVSTTVLSFLLTTELATKILSFKSFEANEKLKNFSSSVYDFLLLGALGDKINLNTSLFGIYKKAFDTIASNTKKYFSVEEVLKENLYLRCGIDVFSYYLSPYVNDTERVTQDMSLCFDVFLKEENFSHLKRTSKVRKDYVSLFK